MKVLLGERRKQPRTQAGGLQGLSMAVRDGNESRSYLARMIDFSAGGLGIEMQASLPVGAALFLACKYPCGDRLMHFSGWARVAYCRRLDDGLFHLGISFRNVRCRNLFVLPQVLDIGPHHTADPLLI